MDNPLVSVVIPTFNRAGYLQQAIASVLAQTYSDFELLVLDNCSPDDTPEVVKQFNDSRLKYIRHAANIGGSANWTYGLYWANGKYLSFLGDDDTYRPEFIARRVDAFSRYERQNPAAVFSAFDGCDEGGKILHASKILASTEKVLTGAELVKAAAGGGGWQIMTALYRTEVVRELWDFALRAGKAGDTALNIRIALKPGTAVIWLPERDLIYRWHPNQDSRIGGQVVLTDHIRAHLEPIESGCADGLRHLLRPGIAWACNILGRSAWDRGDTKMARKYFTRELAADPSRLKTWLRLLRTFFIRPTPIQAPKPDAAAKGRLSHPSP